MPERHHTRTAAARFLRFLRFDIEYHLLRPRWLLVLPVTLFLAYIVISRTLVQASNQGEAANGWDALFGLFASSNILFFVLTILFLYLVSDLANESGVSQSVLLRLGSRRAWWAGKLLTLLLGVLAFLTIIVVLVAALASFALPWQEHWSPAANRTPLEYFIMPPVLALPPVWAFAQLLLLLGLGWFCLGLLAMVVSQRAPHPAWGFGAGVLVNFSGLAVLRNGLPAPYVHLSIHEHLLFNFHAFGDPASPYPPVSASLLYWTVGILAFSLSGLRLATMQDFLYRGVSE